ncbi:MAG: killer suppression protein HigA [Candidatus Paceibacterota bacterium]
MNVEYKTKKLYKTVKNLKAIQKNYGVRAKKVNQRKEEIESSPNMEVLKNVCPNCHPLTGDRDKQFAIEISGNHRIIFEINHENIPLTENEEINFSEVTDIKILAIGEDYH